LPNPVNEPIQAIQTTQSALGYADLMLQSFHHQNLASIQHDLPHLRQWSNLFQHPDATVAHPFFNHVQPQLHRNRRDLLAMTDHPHREEEAFPIPVMPGSYGFGLSTYLPQPHPQLTFSPPLSFSSATFPVPYNDIVMANAARGIFSMPAVTPVSTPAPIHVI
jgi:hypothetical protein